MRNKILIVDDETDIVSMLKDYFELNGYDTITAVNGLEAIQKAEKQPDIILLDINMPDIDGMEVCMRIRDFVSCPILFLTARIETSDKIKGFSVGADDYIIKPFSIDELGARVAAHLRRDRRQRESAKVHFDDKLAIDYTERSLYYNGEQITLSKKEFGIIELLSQHIGQVFSKERIYELVWDYDSEGDSSVIAEHIRRIRSKFAKAKMKQYIETVGELVINGYGKKKKSLKWDFVKYFSICIILILAGSLLLGSSAEKIFSSDASRYALFIGDDGTVSIITKSERIPKNYILFLDIVNLFRCIAIPLWSLLCVVVCGIIFYHRKIEKPISILLEASENISNNRLDFSVEVPEKNEFGELCLSFEKMRVALKENNIEMWRQVEERKRLNAAFSHDLRTPLTVLKGQSEILSKYVPKMSEEKIIETAETMKRHIIRLETYVNTMNDLQRLEDVEVKKELVDVKELEHQMRITGAAVCKGKEFVLYQNIFDVDSVKIDTSIAMQVYENLLSNAVRYAKRKIEIAIDKKDSLLLLNVVDDGAGFTAKDLSNAMKPFYKAENEINNEHFGMGLNICKMLCEKHGGYLQISNENGAKAVAAFKE